METEFLISLKKIVQRTCTIKMENKKNCCWMEQRSNYRVFIPVFEETRSSSLLDTSEFRNGISITNYGRPAFRGIRNARTTR